MMDPGGQYMLGNAGGLGMPPSPGGAGDPRRLSSDSLGGSLGLGPRGDVEQRKVVVLG